METMDLSDCNEQMKRKSVAAEKVIDELIALFKHYTDWPIDSSNLVYNVNLLMDVMVIEGLMYEKGGRVKKRETGYTSYETLMYFCAQFSTKKLFADPVTKKKTALSNESKNSASSDEVTKQPSSPTFTIDAANLASVGVSALSASATTPSAIGFRTFEGEFRQHWKVGARIQLLHSIDWLPGTVTCVRFDKNSDNYDVKLDNGDSVLNVRSYLLRTMEIPPKVVWWNDVVIFLVAILAVLGSSFLAIVVVLAVMMKSTSCFH